MAKAIKKTEKKTNDWPLAVLALYIAVLIAYLPVLFGMAGPISSFRPDFFFAIAVAPVSLVCLLCGALALFVSPKPSLLAIIGLVVLLIQVLGQLIWVLVVAGLGG